MLSRELTAGAGGHADHERHVELAAGHVAERRRVVEDLIECEQAEIDGHDLDDWSHAGERRADACTDERGFRKWRIADAFLAELREKALAHGEAPAIAPHILTHEEDARILAQRRA